MLELDGQDLLLRDYCRRGKEADELESRRDQDEAESDTGGSIDSKCVVQEFPHKSAFEVMSCLETLVEVQSKFKERIESRKSQALPWSLD